MGNRSKRWVFMGAFLFTNTMVLLTLLGNLDRKNFRDPGEVRQTRKIYNEEEYLKFAASVSVGEDYTNTKVVLCGDLDFSSYKQVPMIGEGEEDLTFSGVFDGGGHKITGLHIHRPDKNAGMFARLGGIVKNLRLESCEFSGKTCGGIAAECCSGGILNCFADVRTRGETCGTIVGESDGIIDNCVAAREPFTGRPERGTLGLCYLTGEEEIERLNENLTHISGVFGDTEFCLWEGSEQGDFGRSPRNFWKH